MYEVLSLSLSLSLLIGLVGAAASGNAAPILYNINFTTGGLPASGSFLYDAATLTFSSFNVAWNGLSFNMTSSANVPTVSNACDTAAPNSADFFSYLSGNGCTTRSWFAGTSAGTHQFNMGEFGGSAAAIAITTTTIGTPSVANVQQLGLFTIAASTSTTTPEPSSLFLMLGGGALLAWKRRRGLAMETIDPKLTPTSQTSPKKRCH